MEQIESDKKVQKKIRKMSIHIRPPKLIPKKNKNKEYKKELSSKEIDEKLETKANEKEKIKSDDKFRIKSPEVAKKSIKTTIQKVRLPEIHKPQHEGTSIKDAKKLVDKISEEIRIEKSQKLKALLQKYVEEKDYKKIYSLLIWLNTGDFEDVKNNIAIKFKEEDPEKVANELLNELKLCRIEKPSDKINSETVETFAKEELSQANVFDSLYETCKNDVINSPEFVRKSVWLLSQYGSCYQQGYLKTLRIFTGEDVKNIEEKLIELGVIFKVKEKWRYTDSKWLIPEYATRLIEEIKCNPSAIQVRVDKEKVRKMAEKDDIKLFLIKLYKNRYLKWSESENFESFIAQVEREWNINSLQEILNILIGNGILLVNYSPAWSSRKHYYPAYYSYEITPFALEIVKSSILETDLAGEAVEETPPEKESKEDFDIFEEEVWVSNFAPLVTTDEPNIILVSGVEGMGFNVIKGLLRLEMEDRGHEPNLVILKVTEREKYHEISEIQDKIAYNRIVCIEGYSNQWINLGVKGISKEAKEVARELEQALSKGALRHIVIENRITVNQKVDNLRVYEESKESIKNLTDRPVTEVNLTYSPKDMKLIELDFKEVDEDSLEKLIKTFARILQAKLSVEEIKGVIASSSFYKERKKEIAGKIDAIWDRVYVKRDSAIDELKNKFGPSSKVFEILPWSEKLEHESWEHFIIKQVVIKELLEKGYQDLKPEKRSDTEGSKWEVIEVDGINCTKPIEVEKEIRDKSGRTVKRPDIIVNYPKKIWVEVETCKSLKFPLDFVFDKLSKIDVTEIDFEAPDELWIVFPFRKLFVYGKELIKTKIYKPLLGYYKKYRKLKPRVFLVDLQDERLVELKF